MVGLTVIEDEWEFPGIQVKLPNPMAKIVLVSPTQSIAGDVIRLIEGLGKTVISAVEVPMQPKLLEPVTV